MTQTTPSSDPTVGNSNSPHSDPLDILVIHNRWANENVLKACASLSHEQFHQKFDLGPGSLHNTMTHVLGAMRGWTDMLAGNEQGTRLEEDQRTADELVVLHEEIADGFDAVVRAHPMDEIASADRGGKTFSFTRGGVATHVTTHGMHHRAQCLNMLRIIGVDPLPPSAVVEWMLMVDPVSK